MAEKTREQIWNQFDEMALLVGLRRIPGETNISLKTRTLNHETYNSTVQGLTNSVSDGLLCGTYNVIAKTAFASTRQPLSLAIYQSIPDIEDDYFQPRIIMGTHTWTIESSSNAQRDASDFLGITWSLWKQPDGSYDRTWTVTATPSEEIELRYQWLSPDNRVYLVREKPTVLSWFNGEILETDPDE